MTIFGNRAMRGRTLPATALAGLLLAGCTSGHVGDDWQCPLATGGACDSVAAADPAVPDARAGKAMALGQPLWLVPRESGASPSDTESMEAKSCADECGLDPFGWLARLFADMGRENAGPLPAGAAPSSTPARDVEERPAVALAAEPDTGDVHTGAGNPDAAGSQPETPAAPDPADTATVDDDGEADRAAGLRTGEAVARIWIAPFVDADGIYREAAWVRVVLAPAGWRLK